MVATRIPSIGPGDHVPARRDRLHGSEVVDELHLVLGPGKVELLLEVEVIVLGADRQQRHQLLFADAPLPPADDP
jgi:hypothetical protein